MGESRKTIAMLYGNSLNPDDKPTMFFEKDEKNKIPEPTKPKVEPKTPEEPKHLKRPKHLKTQPSI